jgi:hypothetical protein
VAKHMARKPRLLQALTHQAFKKNKLHFQPMFNLMARLTVGVWQLVCVTSHT